MQAYKTSTVNNLIDCVILMRCFFLKTSICQITPQHRVQAYRPTLTQFELPLIGVRTISDTELQEMQVRNASKWASKEAHLLALLIFIRI